MVAVLELGAVVEMVDEKEYAMVGVWVHEKAAERVGSMVFSMVDEWA